MPNEPLKDILIDRIRREGPIDLPTYMQEALGHPNWGYYTTRGSIGAEGDFTTAPEISQLFGEMVGLWVVDCWNQMGAPDKIILIEPGPGRGTLMVDVLRTIGKVSTMQPDVHLVETSSRLTDQQKSRITATWHSTINDVPDGPFILIANEFFDALPIHQYEMTAQGWQEAAAGLNDDGDGLQRVLIPCEEPSLIDHPENFDNAAIGSAIEHCPAAEAITTNLASRLTRHPGTALFFDYGYKQTAFGDSLQALHNGQYADPYDNPGEADLTAHVNFAALAVAASQAGADVFGPTEQGLFLETLGMIARAESLKKGATERQRHEIDLAVHRLTAPDQMGSLFKVMAIASKDTLQPAGFEA